MKKMGISAAVLFFAVIMTASFAFAGPPKIISVSMTPANPNFGDPVQITVVMCCNNYVNAYIDAAFSTSNTVQPAGTAGQVFVIDANGVDVNDVSESTSAPMGYLFQSSTGWGTGNCTDCGGDSYATTVTQVFNIHVPAVSYFPSCNPTNLNFIVGAKDTSMGAGDWPSLPSPCQVVVVPMTIPVAAKNFNINTRYEGVLSAAGDKVLFSTDYSYTNGAGFSITNPVPAGFTVLSYGPASIPGGSVTSGPALVWNFPDRTGVPGSGSGTVWMLCSVNAAPAGTYTDTATGSMTGLSNQTSSVSVTAGLPSVSLALSQNTTSPMKGDTITYSLAYSINGMALVNFQSFDNVSTGTYCPSGCANSSPPLGWKFLSNSGNYGTWTVNDPCNTGGHYITASSTMYPALLLDDGGTHTTDQFCTGEIVSDLYIDQGTFPGADAQIIIRNNGIDGINNYSLGIVISVDNAPAPGYFMIEECSGSGCTYPMGGMPSIGPVTADRWYRVRISASGSNGSTIMAKIWARGDPEPASWDINYTDPALATTNWACDGTGTYSDWRPGVNEQTGPTNDVKDSYDNFTVYAPRTSANTIVSDNVPPGITFVSSSPSAVSTSPEVIWNLGTVSGNTGSLTWYGAVNSCGTVSNVASIITSGMGSPLSSNTLAMYPVCPGATSITKTANPMLLTQSLGYVTYTISYKNNSPSTINDYQIWDTLPFGFVIASISPGGVQSANLIDWSLGSLAAGVSGTVNIIAYPLLTGPYMVTNTAVDSAGGSGFVVHQIPTATFSPTPTQTISTSTPGSSNTATLTSTTTPSFTRTSTRTFTATCTITASLTFTPTFTTTFTRTPTPTMTLTLIPVFTSTTAGSTTATPTVTMTATQATGADSVTIVSAQSSMGNCFVAGQNITISINAHITVAWANMYALVIGSSGSLVYNNNAGEPDDCLWGLTGTTGNAPSNISPWISSANIAAGGAGGASVTGYQMIVPVPSSYSGTGVKTFYIIIGTTSSELTLGQYYSTGFIKSSITLPECGSTPSSLTQTFTPTFTPTATVNLTPQPTCNMSVTPVFTVQVTYNNGHASANSVVIDVTSDSNFAVPPSLVVHPYGESASKPAVNLDTVKFPGPPAYYRAIYPEAPGYGDIDSIVVTGIDVCGRTGVSNGKYTKTSITGGRHIWTYHNVINPDRHERVRIVYNIYGPDVVHIRVFSRSGRLVRNICSCVESGSLKQDETEWYGTNGDDRTVASGIYYITIQTSYYTETVKVAVIR
jgi:uncharacterized repeat protein (TIGR01451 family)